MSLGEYGLLEYGILYENDLIGGDAVATYELEDSREMSIRHCDVDLDDASRRWVIRIVARESAFNKMIAEAELPAGSTVAEAVRKAQEMMRENGCRLA